MVSRHRDAELKADASKVSLIYTLNAVSHLSKDDFDLLKTLRRELEAKGPFTEEQVIAIPKIQKILDHFNVKTIHEVIDIMDYFKLFEYYGL